MRTTGVGMSIETAVRETSYDEWRERRWRLVGGFVVLLWLAVAVLSVLLGVKRSELATLEAALHEGSVSTVEVVGYPEDGISHGYARIELRWRDWVHRSAEVVVVEPRAPRGRSFNPDDLPVIVCDPADALRALDPDVEVTYSARRSMPGGFMGWRGPPGVVWLGIAAWVGSLLLAFNGPESWRLTRWGWGWFVLLGGPIGAGLYLVLGGPLGIGRPANPARRLTGGWAFLLAAAIFHGAPSG